MKIIEFLNGVIGKYAKGKSILECMEEDQK